MRDCAKLPSDEVTNYLQFILTYYIEASTKSLKRFFKVPINFCLSLN